MAESNVDIIRRYGLAHGVKEEDIDDYVRRTLLSMAIM